MPDSVPNFLTRLFPSRVRVLYARVHGYAYAHIEDMSFRFLLFSCLYNPEMNLAGLV